MTDTLDTTEYTRALAEISYKAEHAQKRPRDRGVWSTGERLAVALALNRADWLKEDGYTMLEAVDRVGPEWARAAFTVQRRMS